MNKILIHYDEIAIKGKNRPKFERQLMDSIKEKIQLKKIKGEVQKKYGRIEIQISDLKEKDLWINILQTTFGVANFSFAINVEQNLDSIKSACLKLLKNKNFKTFRITAHRGNKNFQIKSMDLASEVGAFIVEKLNKKVKLKNPDLNCFVDIIDNEVLVYTEKNFGPGGLPVGINGKAVVLLSGGIDSPVASWYAMKRGLKVSFLHFHSAPYTTHSSIDKVEELVEILKTYSPASKLTSIPIGEIQKKLKLQIPEKYLIIFYRRYMVKMAERYARKIGAKAIITGEALGQVASQTLENILVVDQAVNMLILRPLIGFDKKEIINKAKEIGTYETSILPHDDCCTLFMPKSPETKAKLKDVLDIEKKIQI